MTENLTIFPNAKPKLLGEGEDSIGVINSTAIAGLVGSVSQAEDSDAGIVIQRGTSNGSSVTEERTSGNAVGVIRITFASIVTPSDSLIIITISSSTRLTSSTTNSKSWTLKEDTVTIQTFSLAASSDDSSESGLVIFIFTPTTGTHTYTIVENDNFFYGGITANITFVKVTDTHAAIISTPATATKQINSPDSHTTHEQVVLPG